MNRSLARSCSAFAAVGAIVSAVALSGGTAEALADPPSTTGGRRLPITEVMQVAWDSGFRSEAQLLTVTSIGIAESSLWTEARNWHPEYGYRSAVDVLRVEGPTGAWDPSGTRQLHADRGAWQISSRWWPQYSDEQADDPASALQVVMTLSKGGTDFTPWDTYRYGQAQRHWDQAYDGWPALRPLVRQFIAQSTTNPPNPEMVSEANPETHTVKAGDTLFQIATRVYGNGRLWPRLAEANGISNPGSLLIGQVLLVP